MGGYAVVLAVAACTTALLTPLVRWLALRVGAVAMPDPRKMHTRPMPSLGGAAMFAGFLVAMAVASRIPQFHEMFRGSSEPVGLMLAAAVMFVVGAIDDFREMSPPAKLAGQVLSGSILSIMGVQMLFFHVPFSSFGTVVLSPDLAPLVTVITVVVMANAINLIDGLDGLAAGIVIIAGSALFLYSDRLFKGGFLEGSNIAPLVAIIAVGVCLGFLPFNFNPARIFMGDAGALFLGFMLAMLGLKINMNGFPNLHMVNFFVPVIVLGVPVFDTTLVTVSRIRRHVPVSRGGRDHTSHRLVLLGLTVREAVMTVYLAAGALGVAGLLLTRAGTESGFVLIALIIAAGVAAGYKLEQVYRAHTPAAVGQAGSGGQLDAPAGRTADTAAEERDAVVTAGRGDE